MGRTSIEWTDVVWNPVRGCTKVSPGCKNCYAETFAERWRGVPGHPYEQGFDLRLVSEKLEEPLRWRKSRRRIFVNSMSDLFHEDVPDEYVDQVFGVMGACEDAERDHVFQVLTKRAERMRRYARERLYQAWNKRRLGTERMPASNVWFGVSVENREQGLPRIEHLCAMSAAVRFLSIEPLLEDLGELDLRGINWVIVGGESGHGARPMHPAWVRALRDQCVAAEVPFFFKQWGEHISEDQLFHHTDPAKDLSYSNIPGLPNRFEVINVDGVGMARVGKKAAGRLLDGREWNEMPEVTP